MKYDTQRFGQGHLIDKSLMEQSGLPAVFLPYTISEQMFKICVSVRPTLCLRWLQM